MWQHFALHFPRGEGFVIDGTSSVTVFWALLSVEAF